MNHIETRTPDELSKDAKEARFLGKAALVASGGQAFNTVVGIVGPNTYDRPLLYHIALVAATLGGLLVGNYWIDSANSIDTQVAIGRHEQLTSQQDSQYPEQQ